MIVIELPSPPSVNALFANRKGGRGRGRYPTRAYVEWQREAGWELQRARPGRIDGAYNVLFELKPKRGRADLSNFWKAPSDLLVKHGIVTDDSLEREVTMRWAGVEGCRITLTKAE